GRPIRRATRGAPCSAATDHRPPARSPGSTDRAAPTARAGTTPTARRAAARCGANPSKNRSRTSPAAEPAALRPRPPPREGAPRGGGSRGRPPRPDPSGRALCAQLLQPPDGGLESLHLLAEREAHVAAPSLGLVVESRRRDRRDAHLLDQVFAESDVVLETEAAEIGADVVGAGRRAHSETDARELAHQVVAPLAVAGQEPVVIFRPCRQSAGRGVLEGGRRREGDELVR